MKKILTLLILICFFSQSCKNDDDNHVCTCAVSNPIEDLNWLKEEIQNLQQDDSEFKKYLYVTQNTLNDETIFIFLNCCPYCNTVVPVYNCEGTLLGYIGDENLNSSLLENDTIIWKSSNFSCD